jgi:hypothetical protein
VVLIAAEREVMKALGSRVDLSFLPQPDHKSAAAQEKPFRGQ